uniref:Ornithine decarboxylase antizyme n=1 Tax=Caenorhabditis japonica TaxID=281687 RepID=A0A8R1HHU8_CAEJA
MTKPGKKLRPPFATAARCFVLEVLKKCAAELQPFPEKHEQTASNVHYFPVQSCLFTEMERVLAVFEKSRINPTEGFPRTLRYVGFRPYAIDEHPAQLPADRYFIMSYKV